MPFAMQRVQSGVAEGKGAVFIDSNDWAIAELRRMAWSAHAFLAALQLMVIKLLGSKNGRISPVDDRPYFLCQVPGR